MPDAPHYTSIGLDEIRDGSTNSAEVIVPIIQRLLSPRSVLDVGCGLGTWLSVWRKRGVEDLYGLDGGDVSLEKLLIPADRFQLTDLRTPFDLGRRFDLVESLEVGEHLPPECDAGLVQSLVKHGDVVLFSAAVPGQGGYLHLNEQWQSHWAGLFAKHDFHTFDLVRPLVWDQPDVCFWYRQNILLFIHQSRAASLEALLPPRTENLRQLDVVHPVLFTGKLENPHFWADPRKFPVRALLSGLRSAIPKAARRLLKVARPGK